MNTNENTNTNDTPLHVQFDARWNEIKTRLDVYSCGLNSDWSVDALQIRDGKTINRADGTDVYILDTEIRGNVNVVTRKAEESGEDVFGELLSVNLINEATAVDRIVQLIGERIPSALRTHDDQLRWLQSGRVFHQRYIDPNTDDDNGPTYVYHGAYQIHAPRGPYTFHLAVIENTQTTGSLERCELALLDWLRHGQLLQPINPPVPSENVTFGNVLNALIHGRKIRDERGDAWTVNAIRHDQTVLIQRVNTHDIEEINLRSLFTRFTF